MNITQVTTHYLMQQISKDIIIAGNLNLICKGHPVLCKESPSISHFKLPILLSTLGLWGVFAFLPFIFCETSDRLAFGLCIISQPHKPHQAPDIATAVTL